MFYKMHPKRIFDLIDEIEYFHEEYDQPLDSMVDMLVEYYYKTHQFVRKSCHKELERLEKTDE